MTSGKTNLFRFTKSAINQIPPSPKGKQLEYLDTQVKGLRLRVGSTGKKTFVIVRNGKEGFIRVKVGNFPDMSVETARAVALKKLGDLSLTRKNPNKEKKAAEESNEETNEQRNVTLREALNQYLDLRGERISETTAKQYTSLLSNFSRDWFDLPLAKISRRNH